MVRESLLRDISRIIVWYPVRWLILMLPIRSGILLLCLMGDIHYVFSRNQRRLLRNTLSTFEPRQRRHRAAIRDYFRNYYVDRLLIFIFPRFCRKAVEKLVEIKGRENLDKALKEGNGVILVHGHFGPVHLPLVVLARLGDPMKQIGNPSDEGLSRIGKQVAFRLRMSYERKIPAEIIKANSFLRPVFKWLNKNGIAMITGDGTGTDKRIGRHEAFQFFGRKIQFPLGPALLAEKTGAALLPMFILPSEQKLYTIWIDPPLSSSAPKTGRASNLTGQFVEKLENYATIKPGYLHFLDRI